jgi:hypothetical protein
LVGWNDAAESIDCLNGGRVLRAVKRVIRVFEANVIGCLR